MLSFDIAESTRTYLCYTDLEVSFQIMFELRLNGSLLLHKMAGIFRKPF